MGQLEFKPARKLHPKKIDSLRFSASTSAFSALRSVFNAENAERDAETAEQNAEVYSHGFETDPLPTQTHNGHL